MNAYGGQQLCLFHNTTLNRESIAGSYLVNILLLSITTGAVEGGFWRIPLLMPLNCTSQTEQSRAQHQGQSRLCNWRGRFRSPSTNGLPAVRHYFKTIQITQLPDTQRLLEPHCDSRIASQPDHRHQWCAVLHIGHGNWRSNCYCILVKHITLDWRPLETQVLVIFYLCRESPSLVFRHVKLPDNKCCSQLPTTSIIKPLRWTEELGFFGDRIHAVPCLLDAGVLA